MYLLTDIHSVFVNKPSSLHVLVTVL
jgi:hypothetical protein